MNKLIAAFAVCVCVPAAAVADDMAEATLGGNELLAGGQVELDEIVRRNAFVSGGDVTVGGSIGRNIYSTGSDVRLECEVGGDALMAGCVLTLEHRALVTW
jgi:hypothetical protein